MNMAVGGWPGTLIQTLPASPPGGAGHILPIEYVTQEPHANWCWAACALMVAKYLNMRDRRRNNLPSLCGLATTVHQADCCSSPNSTLCDVGAWPDIAYRQLGIDTNDDTPSPPFFHERILSIFEIKQEISAGRPVQVQYRWIGGGSHVALIAGYYDDDTFLIFDPQHGVETSVSYDYIRRGRLMGRWEGTYFEFSYLTPAATSNALVPPSGVRTPGSKALRRSKMIRKFVPSSRLEVGLAGFVAGVVLAQLTTTLLRRR